MIVFGILSYPVLKILPSFHPTSMSPTLFHDPRRIPVFFNASHPFIKILGGFNPRWLSLILNFFTLKYNYLLLLRKVNLCICLHDTIKGKSWDLLEIQTNQNKINIQLFFQKIITFVCILLGIILNLCLIADIIIFKL